MWTRLTPVSLRVVYTDAGFVPSSDHGRNYQEIDAAVVKALVSEAGPCPRDLVTFLADPRGSSVKHYYAQPTSITHLLYRAHTTSNEIGLALTVATRINPLWPFAFTSESCVTFFQYTRNIRAGARCAASIAGTHRDFRNMGTASLLHLYGSLGGWLCTLRIRPLCCWLYNGPHASAG